MELDSTMINEIEFKGVKYPLFQALEFSAQYIFPVAKKVCIGVGYDIGCAKVEWALPGAIPVDIKFNNGFDAYKLPEGEVDYIFSSHCLEHLDNWITALEYWISCLKSGGALFLYLPHYEQEYWLPWNNRKHKHVMDPSIIVKFLSDTGKVCKIHFSGRDINHSFVVMCERI
jgi:predicted SAM-dependent methyltransferase